MLVQFTSPYEGEPPPLSPGVLGTVFLSLRTKNFIRQDCVLRTCNNSLHEEGKVVCRMHSHYPKGNFFVCLLNGFYLFDRNNPCFSFVNDKNNTSIIICASNAIARTKCILS